MNALRCVPTERIYLYALSCAIPYSKKTKTFLECNGISVLKWPGSSTEMNSMENFWNIMKKEIDNKRPCLKEETWM